MFSSRTPLGVVGQLQKDLWWWKVSLLFNQQRRSLKEGCPSPAMPLQWRCRLTGCTDLNSEMAQGNQAVVANWVPPNLLGPALGMNPCHSGLTDKCEVCM